MRKSEIAKLERANFGSKLGVILATAGSAVGLGNVWRFPYMTGENGGAVFIIIYVACVLLLGIPCMISEFIIGRSGRAIQLVPTANWLATVLGPLSAIWVYSQDFLSQATMP